MVDMAMDMAMADMVMAMAMAMDTIMARDLLMLSLQPLLRPVQKPKPHLGMDMEVMVAKVAMEEMEAMEGMEDMEDMEDTVDMDMDMEDMGIIMARDLLNLLL